MRLRNLAIGAAAIGLAVLGWRDAAIRTALADNTAPPPWLAAADPRLALAEVDRAIDSGASSPDQEERRSDLAKAVLRAAPLDATALRDLALASASSGGVTAAEPGLRLAAKVSRRDAPTQNALLRVAAQRGEYAASFAHLDTLLTASPEAGEVFHGALMAMLADDAAANVLARYGDRPWFRDFTVVAIPRIEAPGALALLLMRSTMTDSETRLAILPAMLNRLVIDGDYAAARQFAMRFGKASPTSLDDLRLSAATTSPAFQPLTWELPTDQGSGAVLTDAGSVEVEVPPATLLTVLQRTTLLPGGSYVFDQAIGRFDAGRELAVTWRVTCYGGTEVWRQTLPSGRSRTRYRSRITIPANCPAQLWQLQALVDDKQSPAHFEIGGLRLIG